MKYLSLLFLVGFILGEKYDVQPGRSDEFFKPKGLKLKVIEDLAVKNVKRGARKWILYPSATFLGIPSTVGILSLLGADYDYLMYGKTGNSDGTYGEDYIHNPKKRDESNKLKHKRLQYYRVGIFTFSLIMSNLLLKKWDKLHKPPAHWTYSDKEIYMSIYEKKYKKFKKRRLLYSALGVPVVFGIMVAIAVANFELSGYSAGSGVGAF